MGVLGTKLTEGRVEGKCGHYALDIQLEELRGNGGIEH